ADQAIWDRVRMGRSPEMRGPYSVLMHVPELADRINAVQAYFSGPAALPDEDRELVILAAVREVGAQYAWARHEARAHQLKMSDAVIEALRARAGLDPLNSRQRLLVELARGLVRNHEVPAELYARAEAELGTQQLVEAVTLTGLYGMIGLVIKAFDVPPAADDPPTF
ncbi:MAG TPA: hypothetical protein VGK54_17585, partial [Chloroflexota bacterium]